MSRRCVSAELIGLGGQARHGWLFTQLITQLTVIRKSRRLADVTESYIRIVAWPMSRRCVYAELFGLGEQARHGWLFTQLTVLHTYCRLADVTEVCV
ncbi:hypothetical protein J6590_066234 [Homalodisca vitripennis]|nr:hypothetical protein J6590_066234 [Homalodisca vitripennis]